MKTIDFNQSGTQELSVQEMRSLNGGVFWLVPFLAGVIAGGLVGEVIRDGVKKCLEDLKAGYDSVKENK
jgi:hypothetical protein